MLLQVRFHGRGGQGIKTAGRILGTALFSEGYEVQDAPRYGAERRGAPLFSYVRASQRPIFERGVITRPDLVVVTDETLLDVPAAAVLEGIDEQTVLLLESAHDAAWWQGRLALRGPIVVLPSPTDESRRRFAGARSAGAAARLVGKVRRSTLAEAVAAEMGAVGKEAVTISVREATAAYDFVADHFIGVMVAEHADVTRRGAGWIDCRLEPASSAAPVISKPATSLASKTGLWRTERPVLAKDKCHRCHWICETFCPDSAIMADAEGRPSIDLEHCKGCMICVDVCPFDALKSVPERAIVGDAPENA